MFYTSTLTAQDIKERFINDRTELVGADDQVINALNDFYSVLTLFERKAFPNKNRIVSTGLSITSTGYDLTTLSNIGSPDITVYKTSISTPNILTKRFPGSTRPGYYLMDNKLFLTPTPTGTETVYVLYPKKSTRVALGTDLSTHTLQIDQDLEKAVLRYFEALFYEGEYQYDMRNDAEQKATEELERYFALTSNPSRDI